MANDVINTGSMNEQAAKILRDYNRLQEECAKCDNLIKNLNPVWDDAAYKNFSAKYETYKPTMKNMQEVLRLYGEFLKKTADSYEQFITSVANAAK